MWLTGRTLLYNFHCLLMRLFITLDFSRGIPQSFVDFCKRAKSSQDMVDVGNSCAGDLTFVQCGRVVGYAINQKPSGLSGSLISNVYPNFRGAELIVTSIKPVSILLYSYSLCDYMCFLGM